MNQKLTPWFPHTTVPVRPGVYISSVKKGQRFYRRWDGKNWHYGDRESPSTAASIERRWPWPELLHWRGLAQEPKHA